MREYLYALGEGLQVGVVVVWIVAASTVPCSTSLYQDTPSLLLVDGCDATWAKAILFQSY